MVTGLIVLGLVGLSILTVGATVGIAAKVQLDRFHQTFTKDTPGYEIRMSGCPFDQRAIAASLDYLAEVWEESIGDSKEEIIESLNKLVIEWVPGTIEDDGQQKRYIVDSFGRKISGDHSGNRIRVVVLETDQLQDTAFIHECCHELHEIQGVKDYNHADKRVWSGPDSVVSKVKRLVSLHKII